MIRVLRSGVLDAPVEAVWRILRDFDSHEAWHPAVAASRIEDGGPPDRVGAVRAVRLAQGGFLREQLIALCDRDMSLTYCGLEASLPLHGYVATLRLKRVTDGDRTFIQWQSRFDPPAGDAEALARLVGETIYAAGIAALQARLRRVPERIPSGPPGGVPSLGSPAGPSTRAADARPGVVETTAIVVERHGGPEVLVPRILGVPPPGPGEIRIRQTAIGVNMIDVHGRSGAFGLGPLPAVPGMEGAGTVLEAGPGVDRFAPGDAIVYAGEPPGGYAGIRVVPAAIAVARPAGLDAATAAAMFLKGITADLLLHDVHPVAPGSLVLVQAAAGALGQMLCGWAHALGAEVIGVVSNDAKAEVALAAGCDRVIVASSRDVPGEVARLTGGAGVDAVFDAVGLASFEASLGALAPNGHLVAYGQITGPLGDGEIEAVARRGFTLSRPSFSRHVDGPAGLERRAVRLFDAIRRGFVHPRIDSRWPLAEAATAHRRLESRQATGAILLVP